MKKIFIFFVHPALQRSRVNKCLIDELTEVDGITFHDLYQAYPEFDVDVAEGQRLPSDHNAIIFHHLFFWHKTPAILMGWQEIIGDLRRG